MGRKGGRGTLQSRRARDSSGTMNVARRGWGGGGGGKATGPGEKVVTFSVDSVKMVGNNVDNA